MTITDDRLRTLRTIIDDRSRGAAVITAARRWELELRNPRPNDDYAQPYLRGADLSSVTVPFGNGWRGIDYEPGRPADVTVIARSLRTDLLVRHMVSHANPTTNLPEKHPVADCPGAMTFNVTINRFARGRSITINATGAPSMWWTRTPPDEYGDTYSTPAEPARQIGFELLRMLARYNADTTDDHTDLFRVHFDPVIKIDGKVIN